MKRSISRFLAFFRATRADADLTREMASHLQLLEDRFMAAGMTPDEARYAARRAFGGQIEQTKMRQRDARSFRWMAESWLDTKLGARMLVKHPGLSIIGGVGIAVAIAISTVSFAFFSAYMTATLPLEEGDRIVALENWDVASHNEFRQAMHDYVEWRATLRSFEEIGAFRTVNRNLVIPRGSAEPVSVAEMTASAFRIARVSPVRGRALVDDDERPGGPAVVVIGHDVWQSRFAADPNIVGRLVRLGNVTHTVVGVMPRDFLFPVNHEYWVPLRADVSRFARGEGPAVFIFGRLAAGVTMEEANSELSAVGQRSAALYPDTHRDLRPQVLPYAYPILDIQDTSLWQVAVMQMTVTVLLLIVAINVAILTYARTATRQGEIAVRTALGASRSRIIAQLFIEAFVLASAAALLGLAIAKFGLDQAHQIISLEMQRPPYWLDYGVPWIAVLYVVVLALLTAIIAGVVPALQATSARVQSTLRELSGGTSLRLGRTWTALIVAQVALAVAAMPLAFGMGWQEVRSNATRPAFAVEEYLAAAFSMDPEPPEGVEATTYRRGLSASATRVQEELVTALEREPWVADVTVASRPPGQEGSARVDVEGLDSISATGHAVAVNHVDVDFFDAMNARILAGRRFATADQSVAAAAGTTDKTGGVVIINRAFAQYILGDDNVLGRRIRYPAQIDEDNRRAIEASPWYEVVGVVSDLHANAVNPELVRPLIYHPLVPAAAAATGSVVVRVAGGAPTSYTLRLRELMAAIDPSVRLRAYPMVDIYRQGNIAMRLLGLALGLVLVSVLLLTAAGVYALMSFAVVQRRREIGIRAALGADAHRLLWSVFARATRQLALGIIIGVGLAMAADIAGNGEFMGTIAPVLVGGMSVLIVIVGLIAAFGPARRGLRLHPTQALREE